MTYTKDYGWGGHGWAEPDCAEIGHRGWAEDCAAPATNYIASAEIGMVADTIIRITLAANVDLLSGLWEDGWHVGVNGGAMGISIGSHPIANVIDLAINSAVVAGDFVEIQYDGTTIAWQSTGLPISIMTTWYEVTNNV